MAAICSCHGDWKSWRHCSPQHHQYMAHSPPVRMSYWVGWVPITYMWPWVIGSVQCQVTTWSNIDLSSIIPSETWKGFYMKSKCFDRKHSSVPNLLHFVVEPISYIPLFSRIDSVQAHVLWLAGQPSNPAVPPFLLTPCDGLDGCCSDWTKPPSLYY